MNNIPKRNTIRYYNSQYHKLRLIIKLKNRFSMNTNNKTNYKDLLNLIQTNLLISIIINGFYDLNTKYTYHTML